MLSSFVSVLSFAALGIITSVNARAILPRQNQTNAIPPQPEINGLAAPSPFRLQVTLIQDGSVLQEFNQTAPYYIDGIFLALCTANGIQRRLMG